MKSLINDGIISNHDKSLTESETRHESIKSYHNKLALSN